LAREPARTAPRRLRLPRGRLACIDGVAKRREREVDLLVARLPVRDREADRLSSLPARAAQPDGAAVLHAAQDLVGPFVALEAEQDLVEHDLVQKLGARQLDDSLCEAPSGCAAPLDERGDPAAAE